MDAHVLVDGERHGAVQDRCVEAVGLLMKTNLNVHTEVVSLRDPNILKKPKSKYVENDHSHINIIQNPKNINLPMFPAGILHHRPLIR